MLESAIAVPISAVSRGQYTSHLLFYYDFSETICVTSRIRHSRRERSEADSLIAANAAALGATATTGMPFLRTNLKTRPVFFVFGSTANHSDELFFFCSFTAF